MNATGDVGPFDEERDEGLLAALSALAAGAGTPSEANHFVIMAAARGQADRIARHGRQRVRRLLLSAGALALGAFAANQWVARDEAPAVAPARELASAPPPPIAPAVPDHGAPAASGRGPLVSAGPGRTLPLLLPPAPDPFDDIAMAELRKISDPLLNTPGDQSWVVGLLFDHSLKLLRATQPILVRPPASDRPDPNVYNAFENLAAKALGLKASDTDRSMATMINDPPSGGDVVPGHPRIFAWAYALRDGAELGAESIVRSAALAHYSGTLPLRPAGGAVALLTVVMSDDGRIEQFDESFRSVQGSTLTASQFDADRTERFAALGLPESRFGRNGSLMFGSDSLPEGKPGGLVIVDYAWPKDAGPPSSASAGSGSPASQPRSAQVRAPGAFDEAAAVALLDSRFTRAQLADDSDGQIPWLLLDANGHLLRSGRSAAGDQHRPLQMELMEASPGLKISGSVFTGVNDPAVPGRRIDAAFFWLTEDSPLPP